MYEPGEENPKSIMEEIDIISRATVVPANLNQSSRVSRIEFTPFELQLLLVGPIQTGLLFRSPEPSTVITLLPHLKTSLSRTLDFFYPLAGRLGTAVHDDNTVSYFLDCNGAGALFVHAAARAVVTVSDILESESVPRIVRSFFPFEGADQNCNGVSEPLLAVQVTELADGIFVGCTINHMVADGASFWHFFKSWSEIARGSAEITALPVFDRCLIDRRPVRIPRSQLDFCRQTIAPFQERVFHFTKEKIAALKARANAEMGTRHISSLQALLAHIWRSVVRNSHLPEDEETTYLFSVGMRGRMRPPLPQQYFGCPICAGTATMKAGELLKDPGLGHAAAELNRAISTFTEAEAVDFLESWVQNPKLIPANSKISRSTLLASCSPRFDVYGNDFGWGKPVAVRSGDGNKRGAKTTLFAGVEEGSIDVVAFLMPETLQSMVEDAEFMEAVTISSS